MTELSMLQSQMDEHKLKLEHYHKRLGKVEGTGDRFGKRIGDLEGETRVQDERITTLKEWLGKLDTRTWALIVLMLTNIGGVVAILVTK